ncbi:alpha/beta fold hydrolase [Pseudoduganella namucuonensis]|uniref:Pimeloyl-ACP methyl ester carboxylesterase n=1 Tax=Pseudoduganella namucuonensis TaxID=1035707 RepID=A0A1I7HMG5_9BURK|nr:alpha/beta hydrolase [Pseudoduganella namucuonensis]SFU61915.1 Pimeloyl-ACP methyl ester carboxylesterase [Pseudoduganella namucuonensis]
MRLDFIPGTMCDERLWGKLAPLLPADAEPNFVPLHTARTRARMRSLIAAHTAPRANLVAFSMGAYLALEHTLAHPERVASLVLICGSARGLREEEKERRQRTMAALEKHAFAGMPPSQLRGFLHPSNVDDASIAGVIQQMSLDLGKETMLAQFGASMERPDLMERLRELRCPVMIVGSEDDAMVRADDLRAMVAALDGSPRATLHLIQGSGHMVPLEAPAPLADCLRGFLDGAPPTTNAA